MGEARRRGTFEERKAQAIAEGRVKKKRPEPESWWDWYSNQSNGIDWWNLFQRYVAQRWSADT